MNSPTVGGILKGWTAAETQLTYIFREGMIPRDISIEQLIQLYLIAKRPRDEEVGALRRFLANRGITWVIDLQAGDVSWISYEDLIPQVCSTRQAGELECHNFFREGLEKGKPSEKGITESSGWYWRGKNRKAT